MPGGDGDVPRQRSAGLSAGVAQSSDLSLSAVRVDAAADLPAELLGRYLTRRCRNHSARCSRPKMSRPWSTICRRGTGPNARLAPPVGVCVPRTGPSLRIDFSVTTTENGRNANAGARGPNVYRRLMPRARWPARSRNRRSWNRRSRVSNPRSQHGSGRSLTIADPMTTSTDPLSPSALNTGRELRAEAALLVEPLAALADVWPEPDRDAPRHTRHAHRCPGDGRTIKGAFSASIWPEDFTRTNSEATLHCGNPLVDSRSDRAVHQGGRVVAAAAV